MLFEFDYNIAVYYNQDIKVKNSLDTGRKGD